MDGKTGLIFLVALLTPIYLRTVAWTTYLCSFIFTNKLSILRKRGDVVLVLHEVRGIEGEAN